MEYEYTKTLDGRVGEDDGCTLMATVMRREVALFTRGSQRTPSQKQQKRLGSRAKVVTTDSRHSDRHWWIISRHQPTGIGGFPIGNAVVYALE